MKIVDEFELNSKTVSVLSPNEDALYYTKAQQLIKYDLETKEHSELGVYLPKGTEAINLDFIVKESPELEEDNSEGGIIQDDSKDTIIEGTPDTSSKSLNIPQVKNELSSLTMCLEFLL